MIETVFPTINPQLYPFDSHFLELEPGLRLHYLDEGQGPPVVMVHGNPTWSAYYRDLVLDLRDTHRCIVPDHIGCGLSDKPGDDAYNYTLGQRVADLTALIDSLDLDGPFTLVVHDWGGMIGMAYAVDHPNRIARLVILNTSAFHLPKTKRFPLPLWLIRNTPLGSFLVRRLNLFVLGANRFCMTRQPMFPDTAKLYMKPYNNWANRIAVLRFVQDIPLKPGDPAYDRVTHVQKKLGVLRDKPMLICWGMRDFVFDRHFLELWTERFPDADVHRFEDCGHYILEDNPGEVIPLIRRFVGG